MSQSRHNYISHQKMWILISIITFCVNFILADKSLMYPTIKLTSTGDRCIEPCHRRWFDSNAWCWTERERSKNKDDRSFGYCSQNVGLDYRGFSCLIPCDNYGYSYRWCFVQEPDPPGVEESWGHCSYPNKNSTNEYRLDYRDKPCFNKCGRHDNTSYSWCQTTYGGGSWGYCSTIKGKDYRGYKCLTPCGYHDYSYKWCRINGGNWGYCS